MKPLSESTLNLQDVPRLFSKYWPGILIATLVCTTVFVFASFQIPKKYKVHFTLTIYSKYFQSPLVGNFVPEVEPSEMRSQRESLIRQVLSESYLDGLGTKYGIYNPHPDASSASLLHRLQSLFATWAEQLGLTHAANPDSRLSGQREALRDRIDVIPINSNTFMVGFVYSDPNVAYQVTQDIYNEVVRTLLDIRIRTLINIRDAIQKRLGSLSTTMKSPPAAAPSATGSESVRQDLAAVREQIQTLTSEYTEEHPRVVQLREQEKSLVGRLESLEKTPGGSTPRRRGAVDEESEDTTADIYDDLAKKLNYLNIALDSDRAHQSDYFATLEPPVYPASPLWPKKPLFALWGFALGLFGSFFIAALKEYFDRSALHGDALARQINVPYLGHLPVLPRKVPLKTVFGE
jgi:hypothetical protein